MGLISTTTKGKAGLKAASLAAKRPSLAAGGARLAVPAGRLGLKASKLLLKRRARQRVYQLGDVARRAGEALAVYGPQAAYELGLVEPPKPKRTAPRVAAGILIGAGAVYFLEPGAGREHREKVAQLVS
jgi:hypothetical protein